MSSTPQYSVGQYSSSQYSAGGLPAVGAPFVVHQINVEAIVRALGTPTVKTAFNQFDEHGLVVGLPRLRGETNWAYKRRILDVFVHQANSSYRGLVNGITRELGLELFEPITINPKLSLTGGFYAPDPYIRFDGTWLYLYSDYQNDVLEFQIDRYEAGGNYEHLARLVEFINATTYFEASLLGEYDYTRSMSVINQSNRVVVPGEPLSVSTKIKLENQNIVSDSVLFSDARVFVREVDTVDDVDDLGDYHIDYTEGIVTAHQAPDLDATIRYEYVTYPFKPVASEVILHNLNSDNFRVKMFNQVLQDDGTYTHGTPTELGADIINELMSVTPLYWGI